METMLWNIFKTAKAIILFLENLYTFLLYSGNYRMWIHSQTRAWHDKNIQATFSV